MSNPDLADLQEPFRENFYEFFAAMEKAGCDLSISSAYRTPERAYLMRYAWLIHKENLDAKTIPPLPGVNIEWNHGDQKASKQAATEMCIAFEINGLGTAPGFPTNHTRGYAVDINISWTGDIKITDASGTDITIKTTPRGSMNKDLHAVGASYNVIKYFGGEQDRPHWSIDGH